jgi:tRNA(fMet)-specific endonuclease VapC
MVCLETDFLIDLLRGRQEAVKKLEKLIQEEESLTVTSVSATELFVCGASDKRQTEMPNVERIVNTLQLLDYDLLASKKAGELFGGGLSRKGQKIGDLDTITAGIALRHNQHRIITKNKKHFEKIHGLKLEGW